MRIIAGKYANRRLTSPGARVRPTSEDVRRRWIDRVSDDLPGASVLDLFAGSGALGLEALSRGAASVDFVENGPAALHALKANVAALREKKRTRIFKRDAIPFVRRLGEGSYDVTFVDAPYGSRKLDRVLEAWSECPFSGLIGFEHARDQELPCPELRGETKSWGETAVTIYRARSSPDRRPTGRRREG